MNYQALQQEAAAYRGALQTETIISGIRLRRLRNVLLCLAALAFAVWMLLFFAATLPVLMSSLPTFSMFGLEFYPLAKAALMGGKHVFAEKPGARKAEEMRELGLTNPDQSQVVGSSGSGPAIDNNP